MCAGSYAGSDWAPTVAALEAEEDREAAAANTIDADLGPTPLGVEIAPWVDELAAHAARGRE